MRRAEIEILLDYHYWATSRVLEAASRIPPEQFTASPQFTWRSVRGTLVHVLDVERSWRGRVRGDPEEEWNVELAEEDFPTVAALQERWRGDEAEMRAWVKGMDDEALAAEVDLGGNDRFPLWFFLLHIVTHSVQRRRDAVILVTNAGHTPREIDFLDYGDWIRQTGRLE